MDYSQPPTPIAIPARLRELLLQDESLAGEVHRALGDFAAWFSMSGMPFFPYFTDHGTSHVNSILMACEALISDSSWEYLTAPDAAVLVLSTLLHDSALHIREEGFLTVIRGEWAGPVPGFAEISWPDLWVNFISEARRWDAKRLVRVFGDSDPASLPDLNRFDRWTQRDRLLIGEFLRRHHPRMAHEIANAGVPGVPGATSGSRLRLPNGLDDFADLAGVVARSHGLEIRDCIPYLSAKYANIRVVRGAHPIFLMGVLRVADYLQIQASRAPRQLLSIVSPRSPISKGEWAAHDSVRDIVTIVEDPEALLLIANPPTVETFLRLREWLDGVQAEVDQTWAVFGEVYGRFSPLNQLGIVIRRIKSNLDDVQAFANTVSYIPMRASFSTAEADLLKLLVAPLYGNRPEIGIRELLQNAVDAVRERSLLFSYGSSRNSSSASDVDVPDVTIAISRDENGSGWLVIEDHGVGMSADVIRNYFLRAGASFRYSDAWRRDFEDEAGESKVLRSGRFGVGAVAAFLLGSEIEVTTRHAAALAHNGVEFHAHLEDEVVELRQIERSVGTTLRVRLYDDVIVRFENQDIRSDEWNWYYLPFPSVRRTAFGVTIESKQRLPMPGVALPAPWHRLRAPGFVDIHWCFDLRPALVCNGIPIVSYLRRYYLETANVPHVLYAPTDGHYEFSYPALSVFDPNGQLPLNLQRTGLTEEAYPFSNLLRTEVFHNFLAWFVVTAPQNASMTKEEALAHVRWAYKGLRDRDGSGVQHLLSWHHIWETKDGIGFLDAKLLQRAGLQSFLVVGDVSWNSVAPLPTSLSHGIGLLRVRPNGSAGLYRLLRKLLYPVVFNAERKHTPFAGIVIQGARVCFAKHTAVTARSQIRKIALNAIAEREIAPGWLEWRVGACGPPSDAYCALIKGATKSPPRTYDVTFISEVFGTSEEHGPESLLADEWLSVFDTSVLPFSREERSQLLTSSKGPDWKTLISDAERDRDWYANQRSHSTENERSDALTQQAPLFD